MGTFYKTPIILGTASENQVEKDLTLALISWYLESEREKGGGLLKKKHPERITHMSFLYRPILITNYADALQAFDCCGTSSTWVSYSIAPSLTHPLYFLISDNWDIKPDSYAEALNNQSKVFEEVHEKYRFQVKGWISDSLVLKEIMGLLRFSAESDIVTDTLPQVLDSSKIRDTLSDLDKIKKIVRNEIVPLIDMKRKFKEKTAEVLVPIKNECAKIEERFNREIDKIRPLVIANKEKIERNRIKQRDAILTRFSGRIHDLQNKRDSAEAKISTYHYSNREPRGGIQNQYSIRDSANRRIRELRRQQEDEMDTVNETYDKLIQEEEYKVEVIKERMRQYLVEPERKIDTVNKSTDRLIRAFDALISNHQSVASKGSTSKLLRPDHIDKNEFLLYLPIILCAFSDGTKSRMKILSCMSLKEGKGLLGGIKELVGMKFMPVEKPSETFANFMEAVGKDPAIQGVLNILMREFNLLHDPSTKNLISLGIEKMLIRGWIKEKEAKEFRTTIKQHFIASDLPHLEGEKQIVAEIPEIGETIPLIKFVNYRGLETQVEFDKLETLGEKDHDQYDREAFQLEKSSRKSQLLLGYLQNLKFPYSKEECVKEGETWVQQMLYFSLTNSEFRDWVQRERSFTVGDTGTIGSRIDFDVRGVGIEVKIFRSPQDMHRLTNEMLRYREQYQEIIVPYINAGGVSNERLEEELKLLSVHYPEIKGYFPLNCKD